MIEEKIQIVVLRFLLREISIAEFQSEFSRCYAQARMKGEYSGLLDKVILPLAEYSRGHRTESDLRSRIQELASELVASKCAPLAISSSFGTANHIIKKSPTNESERLYAGSSRLDRFHFALVA